MGQEIVVREEPPKPLSAAESQQFIQLQKIVFEDMRAFFRVGSALAEIRDRKLYREECKTFPLYCKKVFDLAKSRAYQLIGAAEVVDNVSKMSTMVDKKDDLVIDLLPRNERQVRPLIGLQPDQQREVWESVARNIKPGKKLTASLVTGVVKKYLGETTQQKIRQAREVVCVDQQVSAEFKFAFDDFIEQIEREQKAGYKTTSRMAIVNHLDQLRQMIAEDGEKIDERAFAGHGSDAVKLEKAGFSLFRTDKARKVIKVRAGGGWPDYENPARGDVGKVMPYETIKEMEADFAVLMEDPKHLRG